MRERQQRGVMGGGGRSLQADDDAESWQFGNYCPDYGTAPADAHYRIARTSAVWVPSRLSRLRPSPLDLAAHGARLGAAVGKGP